MIDFASPKLESLREALIGDAPTLTHHEVASRLSKACLKNVGKLATHPAFRRTNGHCTYCGADLLQDVDSLILANLDHVVPRAYGGSNHISNLVSTCYPCNALKAGTPARSIEDGRLIVEMKRHFYREWLEELRVLLR